VIPLHQRLCGIARAGRVGPQTSGNDHRGYATAIHILGLQMTESRHEWSTCLRRSNPGAHEFVIREVPMNLKMNSSRQRHLSSATAAPSPSALEHMWHRYVVVDMFQNDSEGILSGYRTEQCSCRCNCPCGRRACASGGKTGSYQDMSTHSSCKLWYAVPCRCDWHQSWGLTLSRSLPLYLLESSPHEAQGRSGASNMRCVDGTGLDLTGVTAIKARGAGPPWVDLKTTHRICFFAVVFLYFYLYFPLFVFWPENLFLRPLRCPVALCTVQTARGHCLLLSGLAPEALTDLMRKNAEWFSKRKAGCADSTTNLYLLRQTNPRNQLIDVQTTARRAIEV